MCKAISYRKTLIYNLHDEIQRVAVASPQLPWTEQFDAAAHSLRKMAYTFQLRKSKRAQGWSEEELGNKAETLARDNKERLGAGFELMSKLCREVLMGKINAEAYEAEHEFELFPGFGVH